MSAITYECTLTADGFADAVVPITSFQMRLRQSPLQCYLSISVPNILDYADVISDRANGEVTLTHIDGGTQTILLEDANTSAVRFFLGATSRSGVIVAYKQITFPGTGSITVSKPHYRALDDGTYRYRSTPIPELKPTDTAVVTGWESVTVDEIGWSVSVARTIMEFSGT